MKLIHFHTALFLLLIISACGSQQNKPSEPQISQKKETADTTTSRNNKTQQKIKKVPMSPEMKEFAKKSTAEMNCYIDGLRAATMADQVIQFGLHETISKFQSQNLKPEVFQNLKTYAENYQGQGSSKYAAEKFSKCVLEKNKKTVSVEQTTSCYKQISIFFQLYQYKENGTNKQDLIDWVKPRVPEEDQKTILAMIDFVYMEKIHDGIPIAMRPYTIFSQCANK